MVSHNDRTDCGRKARRVVLLCLTGIWLMVAAGCTVGPNFHPPKTSVPTKWSGMTANTAAQPSITTPNRAHLAAWWQNFRDPVLSRLVERAIVSNLNLQVAEARILEARANRRVVAGGWWPRVDLSGEYRRTGSGGSSGSAASSVQSGGTAVVETGGGGRNLFQTGLDAAWELDFFGGVRRSVEAATANIQAAVEDRRDVLVTLAAEVGLDYVNLRRYQQQIVIAENNLKVQQHTAEITRKRYAAGFVSSLDVANANAQVAATEAQIPVLQSAARGTIYSLSVLLALPPAALEKELAATGPIPLTPPVVPVGLPSELLRRRPDIRAAEAQLHAATADIGVATAALFPQFSLTGSVGVLSTEITSLIDWSNRFWSVGPTLVLPIFDGGRIRAKIDVQNAIAKQALLTYQQTVLTALQDVETALVAYAKEQQHHAALTRAVVYSRKAVDIATQLYVAGQTDFLNVLTAQGLLFSREDALAQSTTTLSTDLIALYKALGGGWQKPS